MPRTNPGPRKTGTGSARRIQVRSRAGQTIESRSIAPRCIAIWTVEKAAVTAGRNSTLSARAASRRASPDISARHAWRAHPTSVSGQSKSAPGPRFKVSEQVPDEPASAHASAGRCDAPEISDSVGIARSLQRERGALRVHAPDDPAAARHFERPLKDLAATGPHALRSYIDVADVEVIKPEWGRHCRRFAEHAADRLPCG